MPLETCKGAGEFGSPDWNAWLSVADRNYFGGLEGSSRDITVGVALDGFVSVACPDYGTDEPDFYVPPDVCGLVPIRWLIDKHSQDYPIRRAGHIAKNCCPT